MAEEERDMKARVILVVFLAGALGLLTAGCDLVHRDEVELAKTLMQSLESSSPAASYKSVSPKAALFSPPAGIEITLLGYEPLSPPADGDWTFTLSAEFSGFVPPGYDQSSVAGFIDSILVISYAKNNPLGLTMSFAGELQVSGENAGSYVFDAALHYDVGTGEHSYSGTVQIDGYTHTFKN